MKMKEKIVVISWDKREQELKFAVGSQVYLAKGCNPFHKQKFEMFLRFSQGQAINYIEGHCQVERADGQS